MLPDYIPRFSALFAETGRAHVIVNDVLWVPYNQMIVPFGPVSRRIEVTDEHIAQLLDKLPGRLVRWTEGFQDRTSPWYSVVCRRARAIDEYESKSVRNSLRRSFKGVDVREIDVATEVDEIHRVYREVAERHGTRYLRTVDEARQYYALLARYPDIARLFGMYEDGRLIAVSSNYLYGPDGADFSELKFSAESMKHNRSYGLIHFVNNELLPEHGYTNDGYRSLLHDTAIQDLMIGKLHFEKAFTTLHVRYRPPVKTIIQMARPLLPVLGKFDPRLNALVKQDQMARDSQASLYDLFEFKGEAAPPLEKPGFRVEKQQVGFGSPIQTYWRVLSGGRAMMYQAVTEDGEVAHVTYALPKLVRLSFMRRGDWQIGPANTPEKFRGRGLYPWVISHVIHDLRLRGENGRILMFAHNTNRPSLSGILKAGFARIGILRKGRITYRLVDAE